MRIPNEYYIFKNNPNDLSKVLMIPILKDNYVFIIVDSQNACLIVDPGEAKPVLKVIHDLKLIPTGILITHSHSDHVEGLSELLNHFNLPVHSFNNVGFESKTSSKVEIKCGLFQWQIFHTPGHISDHIIFFEKNLKWLFCGDVLFRFGCGRIFDGTYQELYSSLQIIKKLPLETQIFCTHEYTQTNLKFCYDMMLVNQTDWTTDNYTQLNSLVTIPVTLKFELNNNPFLKASTLEDFTKLRKIRNNWSAK